MSENVYVAKRPLYLEISRVDTWADPPRRTSYSVIIEEGDEFEFPRNNDWDNGMDYAFSLKIHEGGEDAEDGRDYALTFLAAREKGRLSEAP